MKLSKKTAVALIITALLVAVAGMKVMKPARVNYTELKERRLVQEVFGTGTIEARVLAAAGSKITGRVKEVYVDQGDAVVKGQLLAVLENDDLAALLKQAEGSKSKSSLMEAATESELARADASIASADAAVKKSEAALRLADQTFKRYEELFGKGMVSQQELDEKRAALDEAASQRDSADAGMTVARADAERAKNMLAAARSETTAATASSAYAGARLADAYVRSSMDGVVVSRDAEPGDAVVPGTPIFRIAGPETIWVKANIDEAQSGGISIDSPARIFLRSDRKSHVPGVVARISEESDRVTEEVEVNVSFARSDTGRLHLGEQTEVYITGRASDSPSIPIGAVTVRDGKDGVFVDDGGRAKFMPVRTGIWTSEFVEIDGGLKDTDRVIILDGKIGLKIKDGLRVKSVPAEQKGDMK